jgi:hypothetical protein
LKKRRVVRFQTVQPCEIQMSFQISFCSFWCEWMRFFMVVYLWQFSFPPRVCFG